MKWSTELEIGIPVVDSQHERIVDYINQLDSARREHSQRSVQLVLEELIDYTLSHFTFEESLMEEAGYPFVNAHKKVHQLFERRISEFQRRMESGEDVTKDLLHVLTTWLLNHIKRDDRDYCGVVKVNLDQVTRTVKARKGSWFNRLFG